MRIIFNCLDSGLGNNGGSRTIVRSANTLKKMGHNVTILNPKQKPAYNWDKIEVPIIGKVTDQKEIPDADVIIATSYSSVTTTLQAPDRCGLKVHWIRGYEKWSNNKQQIIDTFKIPTLKIVNSICMQDKLKEFNIDSKIIRPGYDFHEIYPLDIRQNNDVITIGGLYSQGSKRRSKRTEWIFKAIKEIKQKMNVKLLMFGGEGSPSVDKPFDVFVPNPDYRRKNLIYNQCDIWLAPASNDSLHIPPAEAMQTECCIVGTQAPMNGMKDYLIHKETGLTSFDNYESFRDTIIYTLLDNDMRIELGKKAREKILSLGNREDNMTKMVKFLKDNI